MQGAAPHTHVQALGSSCWDQDPLPALPLAGTIPSPRAQGPPRLCLLMRAPLGISRGSPGYGRGKTRHSRSIHFLPAQVPPLQRPCPPPWAGMPSTLLTRQAPCHHTTLLPAWQCLQPLSPSRCRPVPRIPRAEGLQPGGFPVSLSFPRERGGSFPCLFPVSRRRAKRL